MLRHADEILNLTCVTAGINHEYISKEFAFSYTYLQTQTRKWGKPPINHDIKIEQSSMLNF